MLRQKEVSATRCPVSGALHVDAIYRDQLWRRTYYGYSKREAIRMFTAEVNAECQSRVIA